MNRRLPDYTILAAALCMLSSTGCETGGVGDPCVPEEEYQTDFSGFAVDEVNVESRSFQCETRICLVNHFQGRVSCPYGQTEQDVCNSLGANALGCGDLEPNGEAKNTCSIPGATGRDPNDQIQVAVEPQLTERRAEDAVYCSCRCNGPDPNARYCECPTGFACRELVKDFGFETSGQLVGSYCIVDNTQFNPDPASTPTVECNIDTGNCDD